MDKIKILVYALKVLEYELEIGNVTNETYRVEISRLANMEYDILEYWHEQMTQGAN